MDMSKQPASDGRKKDTKGRRQRPRPGAWRRWAFLGCLALFLVSGGLWLRDQIRSSLEQQANAALAHQVHQAEEALAAQPEQELQERDGPPPSIRPWRRRTATSPAGSASRGPSWTTR